MLDPRIYRTALLPVLMAVLVVAFSLADRPRPIGTTLTPDAFNGQTAQRTLDALVEAHPVRRAGDAGDEATAQDVAERLRSALGRSGSVRLDRFRGRTLDGKADLVNVVASRPGRPGPGLVVVAHRDAAGRSAAAELSGTAALVELARVAGTARLQRTITFISTTGGSGGLAGAIRAAGQLRDEAVDAVLVLGDVAGTRVRKPWVVPWVDGAGMAPLRLRRTVEAAVRTELGQDPGAPRASSQLVRQAVGVTTGEQGPFNHRGMPAVLVSVSGERGPAADAPVGRCDGQDGDPCRLGAFGRAALRSIVALDNGPDIRAGASEYLVTKKKLVPGWALRLLSGALLLPVWLATIDGLFRARRRRARVGRWAGWALASALPFALAAAAAVVLGLVGLIDPAPGAIVPPGSISVDGAAITALVVLALVATLGFLVLRPLAIRVADPVDGDEPGAGPAAGVAVCLTLLTLVTWLFNPVAALALVPAAHLWLIAVAPEVGLPRPVDAVLVVLGLLPPIAVVLLGAGQLSAGIGETLWLAVLGVAGGAIGPIAWLGWSVFSGCAVAAMIVAIRRPGREELVPKDVTSRGPLSYAGPGSLGGTDSALR